MGLSNSSCTASGRRGALTAKFLEREVTEQIKTFLTYRKWRLIRNNITKFPGGNGRWVQVGELGMLRVYRLQSAFRQHTPAFFGLVAKQRHLETRVYWRDYGSGANGSDRRGAERSGNSADHGASG